MSITLVAPILYSRIGREVREARREKQVVVEGVVVNGSSEATWEVTAPTGSGAVWIQVEVQYPSTATQGVKVSVYQCIHVCDNYTDNEWIHPLTPGGLAVKSYVSPVAYDRIVVGVENPNSDPVTVTVTLLWM